MGCNESIKIILIFAENVINHMNVIKIKIARTLEKLKSSDTEHLIFLSFCGFLHPTNVRRSINNLADFPEYFEVCFDKEELNAYIV